MAFWTKAMVVGLRIILALLIIMTVLVGVGVGIGLAEIQNLGPLESFNATQAALPTRLLDINGRLITQFFSDEQRELVSLEEMPKTLIHAILTREDKDFFEHSGFSITGLSRAFVGVITGNFVGGGSTITQQVAGRLFADRTDFSITRKLVELWYAFQLERRWTKYEILEEYLNGSYFGHNAYGVEVASKFYFGHSARELTYAEAAILVIQLAAPGGKYSPILNPNSARQIQRVVLDQIVQNGFATQEEVNQSFDEYWANYDYSRNNADTVYFSRQDLAPHFSEYVRLKLQNEYLLGSANIYRDGFTVHTTLNLDHQEVATRELVKGLEAANANFDRTIRRQSATASQDYAPLVDLLSLAFDIRQIRVAGQRQQQLAKNYFSQTLNPALSLMLYQFAPNAQDPLRRTSQTALTSSFTRAATNLVEGALISIENDTGYITAMVGGRSFDAQTNSFNRAVSSRVQPGSTFKPLYYAAALDKHVITPATMIYDAPIVFYQEDGTPWTPQNYRGAWVGPVLARTALSRSMNVPSIKVLSMLGFDDAISYSSRLLGIDQSELVQRSFVRSYPIALGVVSVAPIQMARAYATFANQGIAVTPIAVRYIEDRFGRIISEPERQLREEQSRARDSRILSPEAAFLITDLLQSTVGEGTLSYPASLVGGFSHPMAGKTGTTQNWSDLWTVGFSPYLTTAVWIGFDRGNMSLGIDQTGAVTAGPIWARFMKAAHADLPPRSFARAPQNIITMPVTASSGLRVPSDYTGRVITEYFIKGTEPVNFDTIERYQLEVEEIASPHLMRTITGGQLGTSVLQTATQTSTAASTGAAPQTSVNPLRLDPETEELLASLGLAPAPSNSTSGNQNSSTNSGSGSNTGTGTTSDPTQFGGNLDQSDDGEASMNPFYN